MNVKAPINENYAGIITKIKNLILLDNCSNVCHTSLFGNLVIVGKDTTVNETGIFFPAETRFSEEYLHENDLYRDNTRNKDINTKGYFEENGRIRCVKFRGHKSEGIFMPLKSLLFAASLEDIATLKEGDTFDHINGIKICEKYVVKVQNTAGSNRTQGKVAKKVSKLVDNQFRFHGDTAMLGKNIWRIQPDTLVQVSNKLHGTSFVVSRILCKKKLSLGARIAKFFGIKVVDSEYDVIYSSRKVIKNDDLNKNYQHYYGEDLWAEIAEQLKPFLHNGMTVYGEAVGFTKTGKAIQGGYDYGYKNPQDAEYIGIPGDPTFNYRMGIYIYRITFTNNEGKVFEFSAKQVQDWCKSNGLLAVPQYFYGRAKELYPYVVSESVEFWQGDLLTRLLQSFNMEQDCELCKNKVPAEGFVLRIEGEEYDAYKLKSFRFREHETKMLDKGEVDIESQESEQS
jgi:hypothetical protein